MRSQMNTTRAELPGFRADGDSRHRVLEAMGSVGATLHELDYEDLALTSGGLRLVRQAAQEMLRRFGVVEPRQLSPARALALFLDHVFWEEGTGGLILCADLPDKSYCLPIPRGEWGLRRRTQRQQ